MSRFPDARYATVVYQPVRYLVVAPLVLLTWTVHIYSIAYLACAEPLFQWNEPWRWAYAILFLRYRTVPRLAQSDRIPGVAHFYSNGNTVMRPATVTGPAPNTRSCQVK